MKNVRVSDFDHQREESLSKSSPISPKAKTLHARMGNSVPRLCVDSSLGIKTAEYIYILTLDELFRNSTLEVGAFSQLVSVIIVISKAINPHSCIMP